MPDDAAKVLLVDDDRDILRMVKRYLEAMGLEVGVADSPFGVSSRVTRERPAVVVLDVMMPALDGENLAKLLGSLRGATPPPIIFYSALDEEKLAELAARFRNARYVCKPAGLAALHEAIVAATKPPPADLDSTSTNE